MPVEHLTDIGWMTGLLKVTLGHVGMNDKTDLGHVSGHASKPVTSAHSTQ